jgi:RNA polymerase sigma-70 factor (ECF subfamily)
MDVSDSELLQRWRSGDQAAGQELFERYYHVIERFFANKLASEALDLVQETFVACLEGRDRVSEDGKFRSYLFAVACNVLRGHLRRRYRGGEQLDLEEVSVHELAPGAGTLLGRLREQRLLLEALRHIPVELQVALELHYWEQLTTEDMAEALGVPVGTARSRLRRAREQLQAAMERLASTPDELESTITNLDDWARQCRAALGQAAAVDA